MKKIIPFFLLSIGSVVAEAQTALTDSLKQLLQNEKEDTSRVLLLEELSFAWLTSKPETSLLLAQEALSLSRKIGFEKGEAISLNRIGDVLSSTGNYPQALDNLIQALKINERINNHDGIMRNLGNIGNIHAIQGNNREALNYSFKEKHFAEIYADDDRKVSTLISIGDTYEKIDQLDSAIIYTQQAYDLAVRIEKDGYTGMALNNFGNIYSKKGPDQASVAMKYYKSSLHYYKQANDNEGFCESSLGMARLFQNSNQADSALYYAKQSLKVSIESSFTKYSLDASKFLTDYYTGKKIIDSAFAYQLIYIAANETLFSQDHVQQVLNLSFREKIRQQELEEEKIRIEKERKDNIQLMGIATVIVVLFLLLLLLSKRQIKARTVEVYGLISLLFLFEFVSLLIHPFIEELTGHTPVFMLLILVGVAALLIPVHHKLEEWVKLKLAHKIRVSSKPAAAKGLQRVDPEIRH